MFLKYASPKMVMLLVFHAHSSTIEGSHFGRNEVLPALPLLHAAGFQRTSEESGSAGFEQMCRPGVVCFYLGDIGDIAVWLKVPPFLKGSLGMLGSFNHFP